VAASIDLEMTSHRVLLEGLPTGVCVRAAQLSDLHWHGASTEPPIAAAIQHAMGCRPDVVLLTGDFIRDRVRDLSRLARLVAELHAPLGVFAVMGNHDYSLRRGEVAAAIGDVGVRVLHDTSVALPVGLRIAGVDDLLYGEQDLSAALAETGDGMPTVMLAHNPNNALVTPSGRVDVILSGHTHGGQMRFPGISPAWICRVHVRTQFVHGWYTVGGVRMYVNRGIGAVGEPFAFRYRCPSEVSVFDFHGPEPLTDGVA